MFQILIPLVLGGIGALSCGLAMSSSVRNLVGDVEVAASKVAKNIELKHTVPVENIAQCQKALNELIDRTAEAKLLTFYVCDKVWEDADAMILKAKAVLKQAGEDMVESSTQLNMGSTNFLATASIVWVMFFCVVALFSSLYYCIVISLNTNGNHSFDINSISTKLDGLAFFILILMSSGYFKYYFHDLFLVVAKLYCEIFSRPLSQQVVLTSDIQHEKHQQFLKFLDSCGFAIYFTALSIIWMNQIMPTVLYSIPTVNLLVGKALLMCRPYCQFFVVCLIGYWLHCTYQQSDRVKFAETRKYGVAKGCTVVIPAFEVTLDGLQPSFERFVTSLTKFVNVPNINCIYIYILLGLITSKLDDAARVEEELGALEGDNTQSLNEARFAVNGLMKHVLKGIPVNVSSSTGRLLSVFCTDAEDMLQQCRRFNAQLQTMARTTPMKHDRIACEGYSAELTKVMDTANALLSVVSESQIVWNTMCVNGSDARLCLLYEVAEESLFRPATVANDGTMVVFDVRKLVYRLLSWEVIKGHSILQLALQSKNTDLIRCVSCDLLRLPAGSVNSFLTEIGGVHKFFIQLSQRKVYSSAFVWKLARDFGVAGSQVMIAYTPSRFDTSNPHLSLLLNAEYTDRFISLLGELRLTSRLWDSNDGQGMTAARFHTCCDNQGPTIILMKVQGVGIVIAYASVSWAKAGPISTAIGSCWICLLDISVTKHYNQHNLAISGYTGWGPHFEGGFHVNDNGTCNVLNNYPSLYDLKMSVTNAKIDRIEVFTAV